MVNYTKVFKLLTLLTICWSSIIGDALAQTTTFSYTGAMQTYVVPPGITQITVDMSGAQGGNSQSFNAGGLGGRVQATLNVTPGQTLNIFVGGQGQNTGGSIADMTAAGGFNGGGTGGFDNFPQVQNGGGGGGATDIRIGGTALANRVLVAGGGGGASTSAVGGNGGGLIAASGNTVVNSVGGGGGTQAAGGTAFLGRGATAGSLGQGGIGGSNVQAWGCGGGGGGYYGGGGGSSTADHGSGYGASGGGGSSYADALLTTGVTQGFRSGDGTISLTVVCPNAPAVITTNPSNSTVCQGVASTFFSVAASGTSISYQWQMSTYNSGYVNISNNATFSGVTTSVLTVNNPTTALDGNGFRCVVTAGCATPVNSQGAMLTVNGQHSIISQPTTQLGCQGTNTTFSVAVSTQSTNPVTYQWQVAPQNSTIFTNVPLAAPYSGVTSANLTIAGSPYSLNGNIYRCLVTGTCGVPTMSNTAQFDAHTNPVITSNPSNAVVCQDGITGFSVTAQVNTSLPIYYQWQVNTGSGFTDIPGNLAPYSGAQSPILTINPASLSLNNAQYRCVVSGVCGPVATSAAATLTVHQKPTVSNPLNATVCEDGSTSFGVTASGTGISYQWQVNTGSGFANIGNGAPYSGMQSATLSITNVPASFNANLYRCVVSGTCTPAAISSGAELTVNRKPAITANPVNASTCNNNITATFNVTATGTGLTYQWQTATTVGGTYTNLTNIAPFSGVNTSSLSIFNGSLALNNTFYRCVVTGTCAPSVTSGAAQLFINMIPVVNNSPVNTIVCEASNTSLTVSATGTALTYQWQVNSGSGFTNLSNGGVYSGATASTLNITAATTSLNNNQYRCVVGGTCTPTAVSNPATLTVNALTVINTQPIPSTICAGNNTTFSVGAVAGGISYQWQVNTGSGFANIANGAPYTGMQSATLGITNTPASFNGYQYRCIVGSICGPTLTSGTVALTVNTAPAIVSAPSASTVCEGTGTFFAATATGTAINYQWQLNTGSGFTNLSNTGIYSGTTTSILNISSTTAAMNGYNYRVVVTGTCAPAAMATAQLNVNTAPVINLQPTSLAVCNGTNAAFNINASGTGLTYQWQVNNGFGFSNVVNGSLYSGATTQSLGITAPSAGMNGYTYRCIVAGTCPSTLTSSTATLTVLGLPTVVSHPSNTTSCVGSNTVFTVGATGAGLSYQWQVNQGSGFNNLQGSTLYGGHNTASLTIYNTQTTFAGYQYRCVVSGSCTPTVISNPATLSVNTLPAISSNPTASTICAGSNTSFGVVASGTGVSYQWQVDAGSGYTNIINTGVYSGATTSTLNISGATASMNAYGYRCVVSGTCSPAVTSTFALLTVKTTPVVTSSPADLSVCQNTTATFKITAATGVGITYQWQVNSGSGFTNLNNGGIYAGTATPILTINNTNVGLRGNSYRCVVSNGCTPNAVSNAAVLTVYGPPTIISSPADATVCENTPATFNVIVDALNPTYQWEENSGSGWVALTNSANYSLVNTPTLMVSNTTLAMAGYGYRCRITDNCGTTYGGEAVLFIDARPRITKQPTDQMGGYKDPFVFTIDATGTNLTYQWQADTIIANTQVYVNIADKPGAYAGTTTNKLTVIPTAGYQNLKRFRCVVGGLCAPQTISDPAKITIGFANNVSSIANNIDVKVYPNPVSGNTLNVQLGNYNNNSVKVKITNTLGAVVANEELTLQNSIGSINVGTLAAGTYNLQVADADNNTLQVIRFVKQ